MPKGANKIQRERTDTRSTEDKCIWNAHLVLHYLKCIADVCIHGGSSAIQRLALLGNDNTRGLVDYLTLAEFDDRVCWCAFQLVCEVYRNFENDPMKDGLKHVAWNSMMKFKSVNDNNNRSKLNNVSEQIEKHNGAHSSVFSIFSKIATNLCVVVFSPPSTNIPPIVSRDIIQESKNRPKTSKCPEKMAGLVEKTKKAEGSKVLSKKKTCEGVGWSEVQRIAESHFQEEVEQDEVEIEKLRKELEMSLKNE